MDVTISSYATQSGGSIGQGSDQFRNIEILAGSIGIDRLLGANGSIDEVTTISGANSGSIRDSASTGSFGFSSFEQLDLRDGNDTLVVNGSTGGVSLNGSVDLGSGDNALTMGGSAGSIQSLSSGSGNDTFSISAGSITGTLSAGDGSNQLTISGTNSSVGAYSGGSGADTVTLSGGDVAGDIDLGSGENTLQLSNPSSTISGNLTFGSSSVDTLSYAGNSAAAPVTPLGACPLYPSHASAEQRALQPRCLLHIYTHKHLHTSTTY